MAQLSALGEAALAYAAQGWRVFPLSPRQKIPIKGSSGFKDATTDPDQIRRWWTDLPNANIGFATGNGIHVLDIDGEKGEESLRLLELENQGLPPTRVARTGRGRHFYFIYMGELGNTSSKVAQQIDTRSDGGYVVLPPSVHESGTLYEWADETVPLAQMPEWLVKAVQKPEVEESYTLTRAPVLPDNHWDIHPYVAQRVNNRLNMLANQSPGGRNDRFHKAAFDAGRYVAGGYADELYIERETKRAGRSCGLTEAEMEKSWRSGFDAGYMVPWTDNSKNENYPDRHTMKPVDRTVHKLQITWGSAKNAPPPQFFWGNRIAKDSITLIAGDSGIGKSQLCLEITKAITDGVRLYDDGGQNLDTGRVLWACYEDGPVFNYRLNRAGVDATKVGMIHGPMDENGNPADFGVDDIASLEAFVKECGDIKAVFLDPWNHLLDGDENRREDNLAALSPLIAMAERQKVAVIIVAHTSKRQDGGSKDKISGHKILTNKVRSILYVARMEGGEAVAVAHAKHNWSKEAETLTFTVGENGFQWMGVSSVDADELSRPKGASKVLDAQSWLRSILANGPIPSSELDELAREQGIASKTLQRAKEGVCSSRRMGTSWETYLLNERAPSEQEASTEVGDAGGTSGRSVQWGSTDGDGGSDHPPVPAPLPTEPESGREESLTGLLSRNGIEFDDGWEYDGEPF